MTFFAPLLRRVSLSVTLSCALTTTIFAIGFDLSFGTNGAFMTTFSNAGQPSAVGTQVLLQPSGRIIVVGYQSQQGTSARTDGVAVTGLAPAGSLDTTFGNDGKVFLWSPTFRHILNRSILMADGSILIFYQVWESPSNNKPKILKLTPNGQVDADFDPDLNLFPNQTTTVWMAGASSGKIYALLRNGIQHYLVRLNGDGSRDTTFGPNGVRAVNLARIGTVMNQVRVVAFDELPGGKIVLVGTAYLPGYEGHTFVARFDSDTNLDRSFGVQGIARIAIPFGSVNAETLRTLPDGKIIIGGSWTFLGSTTVLFRLTSRGRLDSTFGNRGIAQTSFNNWNLIYSTAVSADDSIFVVGICGVKGIPTNQRLFLMKYSSAGVQQGSLVTNFIGTRDAGASDILLQSDGKILVAGNTQNLADTNLQLVAARFIP